MAGFRTQKPQDVVKSIVGHHQSRFLLSSCLEALSYENIFPHIKFR